MLTMILQSQIFTLFLHAVIHIHIVDTVNVKWPYEIFKCIVHMIAIIKCTDLGTKEPNQCNKIMCKIKYICKRL